MATSFSRQYEVGGLYDSFTSVSLTSTSAGTFSDFGTIDAKTFKSKRINLTATATDMAYKVLGSIDGGANYDITVVSSATLAGAASTAILITDYYTNLKIQVTYPTTTGTSTGTLSGKYAAVTL